MNKNLIIALSILVAIACLVLALVYWATPASQLPHWIPGYNASDTVPHIKHGLAALILAIGAGIFAWFQTGPKSAATPPSTDQ
jgi:amino acid permease